MAALRAAILLLGFDFVSFFLFALKICEISCKFVALRGNLWYHLPVLFFLICTETSLKYCDLAKIAVKTAQFWVLPNVHGSWSE